VPDRPSLSSPQNQTLIAHDRREGKPVSLDPVLAPLIAGAVEVADLLDPEELASLRTFFELLAKWDSAKGAQHDHQSTQ
jgi:hypothetical protein